MGYKIAVFSLNQWASDFEGNTKRILESIKIAQEAGAIYRVGPELELCGYSMEDGFYESETVELCWQSLDEIMQATKDIDMVIDIGMPVRNSALYNCRVICHKGRVKFIRAKSSLARDGNYREMRHFQSWPIEAGLTRFSYRPLGLTNIPFGSDFVIDITKNARTAPLRVGWEICQELWDIRNVSSRMYAHYGCHLVLNSSASYWELRKLEDVNDMIKGISMRAGACYAYSNLVGCDGQRYVFSGRSCIYDKGKLVAITPRSAGLFDEVQMITHIIYPEKIDEHRSLMGVHLDIPPLAQDGSQNISDGQFSSEFVINIKSKPNPNEEKAVENPDVDLKPKIRFELEIHNYVALWLWDYLRRSKMKGFMMPLSGGLDSSSVAMLVFAMCNHLYKLRHTPEVLDHFENVIGEPNAASVLLSPDLFCRIIFKCVYLRTEFSSDETYQRAHDLAAAIGAEFHDISIQDLYMKCREEVGREEEDPVNLLDQNIQARLRMAMTYYLSEGNRIVLATGNVDEGIMGYLTKYDCSSADINPIGGLCKSDLKSYLKFCRDNLYKHRIDVPMALEPIIDAPPSAELTGAEQRDEDEIGITYDEIAVLGRVRRGQYGCSGPFGAFRTVWRNRKMSPFSTNIRCLQQRANTEVATNNEQVARELAELIKRFYQRYQKNRHKLTVLTPALHAESYSPDDNRFDHRQFLFPPMTKQFSAIDKLVDHIRQHGDLDE